MHREWQTLIASITVRLNISIYLELLINLNRLKVEKKKLTDNLSPRLSESVGRVECYTRVFEIENTHLASY